LDNRTDKLYKANQKIAKIGRKVTMQALGWEDNKESTLVRTTREGILFSHTSSVIGLSRIAKFLDPPTLIDGKEPTYRA
jgi:hypothetical protein